MSTNLYLKPSVKEFAGFKLRKSSDNFADSHEIYGNYVYDDKSRAHLMWNLDSPIPDDLKEHVDEISYHESIPQMGRRKYGIYNHESAKCELTPGDNGNSKLSRPVYYLKIKAENLEDIQALVHAIKTGAIQPDESYEDPQGGKSRQEIISENLYLLNHKMGLESEAMMREEEIGRLKGVLNRTKQELDLARIQQKETDRKVARVCLVAINLAQLSKWPLLLKTNASKMITDALKEPK